MQPKGGFGPNILAFDTSGPYISAAVFCDGILAETHSEMARGQAENLMAVLGDVLSEANGTLDQLDAIAVGIGPGNFTGIRISVAAAKGLACGLGVPLIGVSVFEAALDPDAPLAEPALVVSVTAPRNQAYVQPFRYGRPTAPARIIDPNNPPADLALPANMKVRGAYAEAIAAHFGASFQVTQAQRVACNIATMADIKFRDDTFERASNPMYVRAPDAAPSASPKVRIL